MSDPHIVPAKLIGEAGVRALHEAGYRIVPATPGNGSRLARRTKRACGGEQCSMRGRSIVPG
jgi:hypothetical protein